VSRNQKREITIITPTADRAFCLSRLSYYLKRQTFIGDIQWIVSDSGHPQQEPICDIVIDFAEHMEYKYIGYIKKPHKSFCRNMLDALSRVKYDKIIVMEDDDWYHPTYVEIQFERLNNYNLVGEIPAIYYNIKDQSYRILGNTNRASMCQMGFKSNVISTLIMILNQQSAFVDIQLWEYYSYKFKKQLYNTRLCIGIKGMPGNPGIGIGHRLTDVHRKKDKNWQKLEEWIGKEDTNFYKEIYV